MLVTNPHRSEIRASRLMSFLFFFWEKPKNECIINLKIAVSLEKGTKVNKLIIEKFSSVSSILLNLQR